MVDLVYSLTRSDHIIINFRLSSGDIYLSLDISLSSCNSIRNGICFGIILLWIFENVRNFIGNFITNQTASGFAVFWITLSEAVLKASLPDCLAWSRTFWQYLQVKFLLKFLPIFYPYFWQKIKIHSLLPIFDVKVKLNISSFFLYFRL